MASADNRQERQPSDAGNCEIAAGRPRAVVAMRAAATAIALSIYAAVAFAQTLSLEVFPGADALGPVEGQPPAATARSNEVTMGYVFSTRDTIRSVGYAGNPIDIHIGIGTDGLIRGAKLISHTEPILVIGIAPQQLDDFVNGFVGVNVLDQGQLRSVTSGGSLPAVVAGASVSSAVIRDAIVRSAREVLKARAAGTGGSATAFAPFVSRDWDSLVAEGAIVQARLTEAQIKARRDNHDDDDNDEEAVVDLAFAPLAPPQLGQNLLGTNRYNRLMARLAAGEQPIFIAAAGAYSVKGTAYVRSGRFDRLQVVQGAQTFALTKDGYENVEGLPLAGVPEFRELGVFLVRDRAFDPAAPWRLDLRVENSGDDAQARGAVFSFPYHLPTTQLLPTRAEMTGAPSPLRAPPSPATTSDVEQLFLTDAAWLDVWTERMPAIVALLVMLLCLSAILIFQDQLVADYDRYRRVRLAFLTVTLVWLGWIAGAQLSVIHVLTFLRALMGGDFHWETFLIDPLAFILWGFVAVAMLFWGRGVFCGWLCPFGALQELANEIARKLGVRQILVPFAVHERLWPIKYVIFLGLFAVSLNFMGTAILGAEVEPFKTAITLKFMRPLPFVAYAGALLIAGLFIERFFCRYLCPLGAALAIPARLRMFDWLHRRFQCGRSCQNCAERCTVQAIHPNGAINPNECIHCLNCQAMYASPAICPTLKQFQKKTGHDHPETLATETRE